VSVVSGMKSTQRMRVADALLAQIQDGRYGLGDKLPSERNLAEEFSVSRTVVREALGTLTAMEIVESQLGRGSYVISTDTAWGAGSLDVNQLVDVVHVRGAEHVDIGHIVEVHVRVVRREGVDEIHSRIMVRILRRLSTVALSSGRGSRRTSEV